MLFRQKEKDVKTSVWVHDRGGGGEEEGDKMKNTKKNERRQTEMIMTEGLAVWAIRRTISPVFGGPWTGRATLTKAGCCCLLRSNSSYTLDMCRAFPATVLYSLNERNGCRVAV